MALMRATLRLAARHGFSSLGLREISREAGIAPTSFYRHFGDVEELGVGVIRELLAPTVDSIADRARGVPAPDAAETVVAGVLNSTMEDPELIRFVLAERVGAYEVIRRGVRDELARLAEIVAETTPANAPEGTSGVAIAATLEGCDELLGRTPEDRPATLGTLQQRILAQLYWLMRQDAASRGRS